MENLTSTLRRIFGPHLDVSGTKAPVGADCSRKFPDCRCSQRLMNVQIVKFVDVRSHSRSLKAQLVGAFNWM